MYHVSSVVSNMYCKFLMECIKKKNFTNRPFSYSKTEYMERYLMQFCKQGSIEWRLSFLSQFFTFESSIKSTQISFDSDFFLRITKRSISTFRALNLRMIRRR